MSTNQPHVDPYTITRRIDWIRRQLETGQALNSSDIVRQFGVVRRTAARDMAFVSEYFGERLRWDGRNRTYLLA